MYTGKETCQGCGRPGDEAPRSEKNKLCTQCKDELTIGRGVKRKKDIASGCAYVFQHYHAFRTTELNHLVHKILSALHNDNAETEGSIVNLKYSSGSNGKYYKIPLEAFEPLKEFFLAIDKAAEELAPDNIAKAVKEATRNERNKIYNEGVEHGRNLLFALNDGTITPADFAKDVKKF